MAWTYDELSELASDVEMFAAEYPFADAESLLLAIHDAMTDESPGSED